MNVSTYGSYTTTRPDVIALVPANVERVLDVGCSNGALGATLKTMAPSRSVFGIERDHQLAREASSRLDGVLEADLEYIAWDTAFPGDAFDCIIFADVLEHLSDPVHHLREVQHRLRPGGSIVFSFPNIRHVSALVSIFVEGTFPRRDRGIFDRTHLRWFTIRDARELASQAGLHIVDFDVVLRLRDTGGGFLNKLVQRVLDPIRKWPAVKEFLGYQFVMRATRSADRE